MNQSLADVKIARSPMLPQLNLQAQSVKQNENLINQSDHYNQLSGQANQSIFQGGKLWSNFKASRYAAQSQTYQFYRTRQEVLYTVASSFYNVLFARRSIGIADNQLVRAQRQLQLSQQRHEVGLVDMTAVLRAQVEVAAARESVEQTKNQYTVAMERLALELGVPETPESLQEPNFLEFESLPMEKYLDSAFKQRIDLKAAEKTVNAAMEQVNSRKGNYYPDLGLQGSYARADSDNVFYGNDYAWNVSLIASYPLFTGFRDTEEVTRAKAAEAEAAAAARRIRQEIRVAVRSAYADIQTRKKVITSLEDQVASAKANYQQVSAQFEEGLASTVDVVDAETALNEAELQLASAQYQYQLDQLNLQLASGTFAKDILGTPATE